MRPPQVGEYEQRDINTQVEKILRGLGNPEPPLRIEDVLELLRLDRQYYSSSNDSVLREVVSKVWIGAQQVLQRPSLILDVVRKAKLSALWIPDRKRILIDEDLPKIKHRWASGHEVIHSVTEWHKPFLFGDSKKELNPGCHETLEAEANFGTGQLLFLRGRFLAEASDLAMNMDNVKSLAKRFGNTITCTLWRYVEQMGEELPMAGLVTCHPQHLPEDHNPAAPCKYFVVSPAFHRRFGSITERQMFDALSSYCSYRERGPLGSEEICLVDDNGEHHIFYFETFSNSYEVLTLAHHVRQHRLVVGFP